MRPVRLQLAAFGSFPGTESIDFTALSELGLFVVTGPTGSGKTTIFDAMTFALYGKVAGDRPANQVRSHHADLATVTSVAFEFEIGSDRYRVTREPSQDVPKVRGGGVTTRPASAELSKWTGQAWQGIESQASTVSERCAELIGLTAEQFQRVVLLPQGKFADFLLAKTSDRQELLRQLFDSAIYERATDRMKRRAEELRSRVAAVDNDVEHHRLMARGAITDIATYLGIRDTDDAAVSDALPSPDTVVVSQDASIDTIAGLVEAWSPAVAALHDQLLALQAQSGDAQRTANEAAGQAQRFDEAKRFEAILAELAASHPAVAAGSLRAADALRAEPVTAAGARLAAADAELDRARTGELTALAAVAAGCATLGLAAPVRPAEVSADVQKRLGMAAARAELFDKVAIAADEVAADLEAFETYERASEAASGRSKATRQQIAELNGRREAINDLADLVGTREAEVQLARNIHRQRIDLDQRRVKLTEANAQAAVAEQLERSLVQRFAAGTAPRLAVELRDGEPCLVCGSLTHPDPARHAPDDEPVDAAALDAAAAASETKRTEITLLVAAIDALLVGLGDHVGRDVADLDQWMVDSAVSASAAQAAFAERNAIDQALVEARTAEQRAVTQEHDAQMARAAAEERLRLAKGSLTDAERGVEGLDVAQVSAELALARSVLAAVPAWDEAMALLAGAVGGRDTAAASLDSALSSQGFADLAEAGAVALPADAIRELEAEAKDWQTRSTDVEGRLAQVRLTGVPDSRPDVDALVAKASLLVERERKAAADVTRLDQRLIDVSGAIAAARLSDSESSGLRHDREVALRVYNTCAALGPHKISLEAWVLAEELERVTAAATVHLQRMTNGRFGLIRLEDAGTGNAKKGLDLSITDSHTGVRRAPSTLSGGERFQASLALALGLADVISQGGSGTGRVFEALFVDEGFGSLDPEALDDAIEALHHLRASGRMVGAITHVDAMKQQLSTGIEVRRRPDGKGSMIVQAMPS